MKALKGMVVFPDSFINGSYVDLIKLTELAEKELKEKNDAIADLEKNNGSMSEFSQDDIQKKLEELKNTPME